MKNILNDINNDGLNETIQILNSYEEVKRQNTECDCGKIIKNMH